LGKEARVYGRDGGAPWRTIVVLTILSAACFVGLWMVRYRFDRAVLQNGESYPVRINRLTGNSQVLYRGVWKPASILPTLVKPLQDLSPDDLRRVTVEGMSLEADEQDPEPMYAITVHNGSDFILKAITVQIVVKDFDGVEVLSKAYMFSGNTRIQPHQSGSDYTSLGFAVGPKQSLTLTVVEAKGIRG
jgi:hypothetical protein